MCKKTIVAVLVLLPLLFACGNPPRKAGAVREERRTPELLAAVPSDALAVICYEHCADGMRLYDTTSVLAQLNLTAFKNARMALSLCYNGSLVPVLALDCGRAEADSVSAVSALRAQAANLKLHTEYYPSDKESGRRSFLVITPSEAQLTAVKRHLGEYTSILDAPGFRQALSAAASNDFVIFRNSGAERLAPKGWLQEFFPRRDLTAFLSALADWTVLTPAVGGFSIQPVCDASDTYYANILGSLPPADSRLEAILPCEVRFAMSLTVSNPQLREAVERWQDASVRLTRYQKALDERKKAAGKDPLLWEKELDIREVALVRFDGGTVALVRPAKAATEHEPAANTRPGFLPVLYGSAFALADDSTTATYGGWHVFGSDSDVRAFLEAERPAKEEPRIELPGKGCRFLLYEPEKTLAWGRKGIDLIWNSNQ